MEVELEGEPDVDMLLDDGNDVSARLGSPASGAFRPGQAASAQGSATSSACLTMTLVFTLNGL